MIILPMPKEKKTSNKGTISDKPSEIEQNNSMKILESYFILIENYIKN